MKNTILVIGALSTLVLAILWYFQVVSEPLVSIGTGILTVIGYMLIPNEEKKNNTVIMQQHTGQGDNVLGNKTINNNYTIVEQEKEREKGNSKISNFSAIEIKKAVDESPVFQQEEIAKNYRGIRVKWNVSLISISSPSGSIVNLMTTYEGNYPWVCFKVDLNDHPTLKVAKKGKKFIVTGLILGYKHNSFDIDLENIEEA